MIEVYDYPSLLAWLGAAWVVRGFLLCVYEAVAAVRRRRRAY